MELIESIHIHYAENMGNTYSASKWPEVKEILEQLKSKVNQLENQKSHFQRKHLEVWQFLDEHYPEAGRDFDILQSGGELE